MEENRIQLDFKIALEEAFNEIDRLNRDLIIQRTIGVQLSGENKNLNEEIARLNNIINNEKNEEEEKK